MSSDSDSCLGRLAFRVLGPVEVRAGDKVVDLGRPRFRAVLAYLLTHPNRIVSTDQLIEALWGGATPSTARAQIQASISMLRRALSAYGAQDIIGTHSPGYLIRIGSGQLDLEVFTEDMSSARQAAAAGQLEVAAATLRRALSRWSGPALANVTGAYVEQTRACLEERRLAALEKLADVELAMGRHAEVVTQLSALVSADPLRESLAGRLMLALYRCGRRSDALQVARQVRRILVEREGLDPGRELAALESSILQSDATLDWTPPREHQPADVPTREGLARPRASAPNWLPPVVADFTGREAALRWLDSLHGTDTGTSRVAIITGSAGVGKTALAVHWARLRADAFADGQFYVNLRGSSTLRRVRPVEVVSTLLRELGVAADQIPVDLDEASALYRRLLADRRALVLLDDAVVAEQVRPLLPTGSTNVLLVTSRKPAFHSCGPF